MIRTHGTLSSISVGYLSSALIVCAGIGLINLFEPFLDCDGKGPHSTASLLQGDSNWYHGIASDGYCYDPSKRSNVAFFPAYPMTARTLSRMTSLPVRQSLLVTSNLFFFAALVCFCLWVRDRGQSPDDPALDPGTLSMLICLFPTAFFFRIAYSESVFLFFTAIVFLGISRQWPRWLIALLVGAGMATRPVGLVLALPFALHLWSASASLRHFAFRQLPLLAISFWGLLAYCFFLWLSFGDPLAFARTQEHWNSHPKNPLSDQLLSLSSLEPIWGMFDPQSYLYRRFGSDPTTQANYYVMLTDRLVFLFMLTACAVGWQWQWLNRIEASFGLGLLLFTYVLRAYEMNFYSQARFSTVCLPAYLVIGRTLARLPSEWSIAFFSLSSLLLFFNICVFTSGVTFI